MNRMLKRMQNASLKTKYVAVFLGVTIISYTMIFGFVYARIMKYEMKNLQHYLDTSMEQARAFIQYETRMVTNASETLYYNRNVYLAFDGCLNEQERDPGQEYRYWYDLDQFMQSLQTGNICNVRIYAPDQYLYRDSTDHFSAIATCRELSLYDLLAEKGERPVWTVPYVLTLPETGKKEEVVSLIRQVVQQDDYSKTLCVEAVSLPTSSVNAILTHADSTENGCVFIANGDGALIGISKPRFLTYVSELIPKEAGEEGSWQHIRTDGQEYMVSRRKLEPAGWTMSAAVSMKELNTRSRKVCNGLFWGMVPIMFLSTCVIYFYASGFSNRIKKLSYQMEHWRDGSINEEVSTEPSDEVGRLGLTYKEMQCEIGDLMQQKYESGIAIKDAELKALQAQINPHFLYNTLDLINWEAMERDAPEIAELVQMLARYYKSVLSKGFDEVSLSHELEQIRTYVKIQNFRFDGRIMLDIKVPEDLMLKKMLKLTLQPIVENAISHGISSDDEIEEEWITIRAFAEEEDITITIEDDGKGMTQDQLSDILKVDENNSHYAVSNIHSRMKLKYGDSYGLSYESAPGHGTKVTIRTRMI